MLPSRKAAFILLLLLCLIWFFEISYRPKSMPLNSQRTSGDVKIAKDRTNATKIVKKPAKDSKAAYNDYEEEFDIPSGEYKKRIEVRHVDCARLINGDEEYTKAIAINRPKMLHQKNIDMSCEAIKARILPARNKNTGFPIAFAKVVHQNYAFLEEQLAITYAEENWYCFVVDEKAQEVLHHRFKLLAKCLPNVIVAPSLDIGSTGQNQNAAHLSCLERLRHKPWKYAILLQNTDIIIKTHEQMTEIFRIYNGANDIEQKKCPFYLCISALEMNMGKLGLCPKHLSEREKKQCESSKLTWAKGAVHASLSRAAVDFIFTDINITGLQEQLNTMKYGVDEILFATINMTPEIMLPGGFTKKCITTETEYITRYATWYVECKSGYQRNSVCVYGVEDLPDLENRVEIMANKMLPDFDYAAIACIGEMLFNRTRGLRNSSIDSYHYSNINLVRYHKERRRPEFDEKDFKCHVPLSKSHSDLTFNYIYIVIFMNVYSIFS